ncbi:terpene cyclase/mutase family protein [Candidatus Woesearchaeota archaeon]|nr:terpene cyclase/mutase family protein [Candidatus Woesearchaeota archaeon]
MKYKKSLILFILILVLIILFFKINFSINDIRNIEKEELENRLNLAGEWLLRMQMSNGNMEYEYFPLTDEYSKERNMIRHTASLWGFGLLYQNTKDQKYSNALEKGINLVLNEYYTEEDDFAYIKFNNEVNIGTSGFIILAMLSSENPNKYKNEIEKLKNFIIRQQREDGSFKTYYLEEKEDSEYYPGEALLALINLYEYDKNEEYLDVLNKALPYYMNYFDENPNVAMVTWHSQAYSKAFLITKNPEYAKYVFILNDWVTKRQNFGGDKLILGGYGSNPGISTSVYNEGVNDAFLVAKELNNEDKIKRYKLSIKLANQFLLKLQSMDKNNKNSFGGFGTNLNNPNQRIDHTQHSINSLRKTIENYELIYEN